MPFRTLVTILLVCSLIFLQVQHVWPSVFLSLLWLEFSLLRSFFCHITPSSAIMPDVIRFPGSSLATQFNSHTSHVSCSPKKNFNQTINPQFHHIKVVPFTMKLNFRELQEVIVTYFHYQRVIHREYIGLGTYVKKTWYYTAFNIWGPIVSCKKEVWFYY